MARAGRGLEVHRVSRTALPHYARSGVESRNGLILGPYMARQGQLFLQYFSELLDTSAEGDRRLVYFDGDDLQEAFDRLCTTMLDAMASHAIFGDREKLHRDVLADETTRYLREMAANHRAIG